MTITCRGLVTRPRVAFSVVSHSILHLHKHTIWLWFYSLSSWWQIGDIITLIRSLNGCTSIRCVYLHSSRKYLSLSNNKHATLHQMLVHCIRIIIISTLHAQNHIIIKFTWTSHNRIIISTSNVHQSKVNRQWHVHRDTRLKILYIYVKRMAQYTNGCYSWEINQNDTKWCWHTNQYIGRDQN